MPPTDFGSLSEKLTGTAWRAGRAIMAHFGTAAVEHKADESPVTAADRDADALIVEELSALVPDIPIVSEESVTTPVADPGARFFLVDPLDGTKEFIQQRGEFTVNIALIEDGVPTFGLVYAPALADIYMTLAPGRAGRAKLDTAADLPPFSDIDWTDLRTRSAPGSELVAAVSRSHLDDATTAFLAEKNVADTITGGSSVKFCLVAEGKADVYPRFGRTMEWDTAAGHAVLRAAGGTVVDETGAPLLYGKTERGLDNPGFIAWGVQPGA